MTEDQAYEKLCLNCPQAKWCHDNCEVCEAFMEATEE